MCFDSIQMAWFDAITSPIIVIDHQLCVCYTNRAAQRLVAPLTSTCGQNVVELLQLSKEGCDMSELLARLMVNLDLQQTTEINRCTINNEHLNWRLSFTKVASSPSNLALLQVNDQYLLADNMMSFFENSPIAIMLTDKNDIISSVNPTFESLFGYKKSELLGLKPDFLRSGLHEESQLQKMWKALEQEGKWKGEVHHRKKDGAILTNILSITRNEDTLGEHYYISFLSDISNHFHEIRELKQRAYYDYLTKLPNRFLLEQEINVLTSKNDPFYVNFIDLGKFKEINDQYGHEVGDKILVKIGQRLLSIDDVFICRYGGDEFISISRNNKVKEIESLLEEPFFIKQKTITIDAHIGTAFYPDDSINIEELLIIADKRMYQEKKEERHGY